MKKLSYFQRRFSDMKKGQAQIGGVVSVITFLIVAYDATPISDYLNVELFVSIFIGFLVLIYLLVGRLFRRKQQPVEQDLGFLHAPLSAKNFRIMIESNLVGVKDEDIPDYIKKHIEFLKKIEEKRF